MAKIDRTSDRLSVVFRPVFHALMFALLAAASGAGWLFLPDPFSTLALAMLAASLVATIMIGSMHTTLIFDRVLGTAKIETTGLLYIRSQTLALSAVTLAETDSDTPLDMVAGNEELRIRTRRLWLTYRNSAGRLSRRPLSRLPFQSVAPTRTAMTINDWLLGQTA